MKVKNEMHEYVHYFDDFYRVLCKRICIVLLYNILLHCIVVICQIHDNKKKKNF